jgi:hypothetical protein
MKPSQSAFALPKLASKTPLDTSLVEEFAKAEVNPVAPRMPPQVARTEPEKEPVALHVVASLMTTPSHEPEGDEKKGAGESRLIVSMPAKLHRELKVRCAERGITIRSYMLSLLEADGLG